MISISQSVSYRNKFFLAFLSFFVWMQISQAQVKFSAISPQKQIGKNEYIQIEFKVENADHIETIIPPSFDKLKVVSGPNQQRGMRSINGITEHYVSIGFTLLPPGPGTYRIGAATARADGQEFTTSPVTIKVTNEIAHSPGKQTPPSSPYPGFGFDLPPSRPLSRFDDYLLHAGEDPVEKIKKNLFLKLEVNRKSCYVGEPISAAFKLYSRLRSETQITDAPSFNGFSVSELDTDNSGHIEEYNGRKYTVYTLRKVQLYPMQAGDLKLDPLVADNKVSFLNSEVARSQQNDLFFDMMRDFAQDVIPQEAVIDKNVTLKSDPAIIHVKPLPQHHVPADFKGAVGDFTITANLENNEITSDDAGNLIITLSGKGNIQLINAPEIKWPENLEGYEAKMKENLNRSSVPITGSKMFTFPFTVTKAGDYIIDPISFSFFNPATSTYETLKTDAIHLHVKQGLKRPLAVSEDKPLEEGTFMKNHAAELIYGFIGVIVFLLLGLVIRNVRRKNKEDLEKEIRLDNLKNEKPEAAQFSIPANPLIDAHNKLAEGNAEEFFMVLSQSLKKYLSGKLQIPPEEISRKTLHEQMDKCNVGLGTIHLVNSLLDEIEINLYSKPGQQHLQNAFEKASEVVALLDKQC